ncbi:uncharacterized protein E0L32_007821 [Thyridium curvatum]|uniref:Uncharacterized protein n=1 Tax=Thyridium curvatum TaxID=1093900 RepID=A0A507ANC1_9PEZI|nr:uncharacterized protein E0L32_007821 [Thyridium curvatum]TPX11402.1 hypothetical protein E0L32_007821 [Thyridium curvatum]
MFILFDKNQDLSRGKRLENRTYQNDAMKKFLHRIFKNILKNDKVQEAMKLVEQSNKEDREIHLRTFRKAFIKHRNEWVAEALKQGRDQEIYKTLANAIRRLRPTLEFQAASY